MLKSTTPPDTMRITLAMTVRTIKDLRLLAVLRGRNANFLAEDFLLIGGLREALEQDLAQGRQPVSNIPALGAAASITPDALPTLPPGAAPQRICPVACPAPSIDDSVAEDNEKFPW